MKPLTLPQLATLAYIAMKCEVSRYGNSNGTIPMQQLVKRGLLCVVDASWGGHKVTCWSPTYAGKLVLAKTGDHGTEAMSKAGYI